MTRIIVLLAIGLACVTAPAIPPRREAPPEIAARENPVSLTTDKLRYYTRQFRAKCSRCHGEHGDGGGEEAKAQVVPPRDFSDTPYMNSRTDGQLFHQILIGGGERCAMPAFGPGSDQNWSEEKIWYMVDYIRRFTDRREQ
jgi:mono/diheme cytochrome c family protein